MDIEARKIELIQEIIKLKSEKVISALEDFFATKEESVLKPFTIEELEERIAKAEDDFEKGRFISHEELFSKYE
jgi:hypothetical protein